MMFDASVFTSSSRPRRNAPPEYRGGAIVHSVRWSDDVPSPPLRARGVKRLGLAYERRVLDVLEAIYGTAFTASPGIRYKVRQRHEAAIPDGILRLGDDIFIIEVKLCHTVAVWPQLMLKYLPLVRALEPQRRPLAVEICRSYDPDILLPGPHTVIESIHKAVEHRLGVLRWKI